MVGQDLQMMDGNLPLTGFVGAIYPLVDTPQCGNFFLREVMILPQIPYTRIRPYHLYTGSYCNLFWNIAF